MKIRKNPAQEAIDRMRNVKGPDGKQLYTDAEIKAYIASLDLNEKDLPKFQFVGEADGTKPVTTTDSLTDFDEAAAARLGKQTIASKTANTIMAEQNRAREIHNLLHPSKGGGGESIK